MQEAAGLLVRVGRRGRNGAGVATQLDVIQSERDLFAAEVSLAQADAELATARAQFALSTGAEVPHG